MGEGLQKFTKREYSIIVANSRINWHGNMMNMKFVFQFIYTSMVYNGHSKSLFILF